MRRDLVERVNHLLDGTSSSVPDRPPVREVTVAQALRPAEPLNEGAFRLGLEAMWDEVDATFAEDPEPGSDLAASPDGPGWMVPASACATTESGIRVVTARVVDPLNDAALAEIAAQAAALVAVRKHDRTGSR